MKNEMESMGTRHGVVFSYRDLAASTNDLARDASYGHGDVVLAERQTSGRGQQGNTWESESGKNLTFSIVLTPYFLPAGEQFSLLQAVSLAVADTLAQFGLRPRIKWPNDIYVDDRKIAGLLIENDICGMYISRTVAGIGLNVNQIAFSENLPNPTSMALETGKAHDRAGVFGTLYDHLSARFDQLLEGDLPSLQQDYFARLYRLAEPHEYRTPDGERFRGIIRDVAPTGELFVEHLPGGEIHTYLFKEIEFV